MNQNGLDIETLKSSRLPLSSGTQMGDSSAAQCAGTGFYLDCFWMTSSSIFRNSPGSLLSYIYIYFDK